MGVRFKIRRILVLNNSSETLDKLVNFLKSFNEVKVDVKKPGEFLQPNNYHGVVISGGFLPNERYRELLIWYKNFLSEVQCPVLGICLGLRIFGYCYGARIRKMEKEENGIVKIFFHREYPLAPGRKELTVYETHLYELISTGEYLENYGSSAVCRIQAVKHKSKPHYAVQFHPEVGENNEGPLILENFVRLCVKQS